MMMPLTCARSIKEYCFLLLLSLFCHPAAAVYEQWEWDGALPVTEPGAVNQETGSMARFQMVSVLGNSPIELIGTVIATNTTVQWTSSNGLLRIRNEHAGETSIRWDIVDSNTQLPYRADFDLVISDLDGSRLETVTVNEESINGYRVERDSNIVVISTDTHISFIGSEDFDSSQDAVQLSYKNVSSFTVTYLSRQANSPSAGFSHDFSEQQTQFISPVFYLVDAIPPTVSINSVPTATVENQSHYTVQGICSPDDDNVVVNISGASPVTQAVACVSGMWRASFDVSTISSGVGAIVVNAQQADAMNNLGVAETVMADKTQSMPFIQILEDGTGGNNIYETNELAACVISGSTQYIEARQIVNLTISDGVHTERLRAEVNAQGEWSSQSVDISHFMNLSTVTITADVSTLAGLAAEQAVDTSVVNVSEPVVRITHDGSGGDAAFGALEYQSVIVAGQTEWIQSGQYVYIEIFDGKDTVNFQAPVQDGGAWESDPYDLSVLKFGSITITANVSNRQGVAAQPFTVHAQLINDLPKITAVDLGPTNDSRPIIHGSSDQPVGAAVFIRDNITRQTICSVLTNDEGSWQCQPSSPLVAKTHELIASITDSSSRMGVAIFTVTVDLDSDDDGITDVLESLTDTDGDGVLDAYDTDSDNDGILDVDEVGDIPALVGLDSDGDGIDDSSDVDLTGGDDKNLNGADDRFEPVDTDHDQKPDYLDLDSDGDGILDLIETSEDTDQDLIPNYRDTDVDNDGLPDVIESGVLVKLSAQDSDGDGIDDFIDVDLTSGSDENLDNIDDARTPLDTDNDGLYDFMDLDSDGDGIPDTYEVDRLPTLTQKDTDLDGLDDALDVHQTLGVDVNRDGIDDAFAPNDTDHDGLFDYQDLDSDSDGIFDGVEANLAGVDSDGDQIDDALDVNQTLGEDINRDGIDDNIFLPDTDGDKVLDFRDLDSDNDTLFDVQEAGLMDMDHDGLVDNQELTMEPRNSDAKNEPDFRELDSDGDGEWDITENGYAILDIDHDGVIDDVAAQDTDHDGVLDIVDPQPHHFGASNDVDQDGILNIDDVDDDNDGIADRYEAINGVDIDTDGDGLSDRFDLDSDNDGLPDAMEGFRDSFDLDGDGRMDSLQDIDLNGLDDRIDINVFPLDSDFNTLPDFRQLDSDGDGLYDIQEALDSAHGLDTNQDGIIDSSVDLDLDGLKDIVDGEVFGKTNHLPVLSPLDSDGDGEPDYRVLDSDGDGFSDALENGDFDKDGVQDRVQEEGLLRSAIKGGGASFVSILSILLALVLVRLTWSREPSVAPRLLSSYRQALSMKRWFSCFVLASLACGMQMLSAPALADNSCGRQFVGEQRDISESSVVDVADNAVFQPCWYLGLGAGLSHLSPDGQSRGWGVSDDSSQGYHVVFGRHLSPHWFAEVSYVDAGSAELSNVSPDINNTIDYDYTIPALHIGYWLRQPERVLNFYGKAGVSAIQNDVDESLVNFSTETDAQFAAGLGLQWRFKSRWFVRAGYDWFDEDARYTSLMLGAYLGGSRSQTIPKIKFDEKTTVAPEAPTVAELSEKQCKRYDGALPVVYFESDSSELNSEAKSALNEIVVPLKEYSGMRLGLYGHTDSKASEEYNKILAKKRVIAVARYLVGQGVDSKVLYQAVAGESRPAVPNSNPKNQAKNRRVELIVLDKQAGSCA